MWLGNDTQSFFMHSFTLLICSKVTKRNKERKNNIQIKYYLKKKNKQKEKKKGKRKELLCNIVTIFEFWKILKYSEWQKNRKRIYKKKKNWVWVFDFVCCLNNLSNQKQAISLAPLSWSPQVKISPVFLLFWLRRIFNQINSTK